MTDALAAAKTQLRREMRARLRAVTLEDLRTASMRICAAVQEHPAWAAAKIVGLFAPLEEARELDLTPLTATPDKLFAYPRVLPGSSGTMDFCLVQTPVELVDHEVQFPSGRQVILRQPGPEQPAVAAARLDLLIVPGLAFTKAGLRLGRGGGFYDRFLANPGLRATTLGVALPQQILQELPAGPHDVPVNYVLT